MSEDEAIKKLYKHCQTSGEILKELYCHFVTHDSLTDEEITKIIREKENAIQTLPEPPEGE